ncbi:hypothetical protein DL769_002119 [Monosporascus sp. CRB-8-3]|nr:hypothetical protein DL769_002119 [Monosporascus sp. CRB-8-3]
MSADKEGAQAGDGATPDITVFRGWEDPGRYVWSPYVIKLEARLRFGDVRYGVASGSLKKAPKGKIPYVECRNAPASIDGETWREANMLLSDSTLIIKALSGWGIVPDLNAVLGPGDRAKDLALRALLEERLYFYHTWERWMQNYYAMRDHVLRDAPYPVRVIVGLLIYRKTTATLHGQGTGRFAPEEIAMFRLEIWEAFSDLLRVSKEKKRDVGETRGPFWALGGEDPTEADCVLFGFIVSVLICTAAPDSQKVVRGFPILLEYAGRIHDRYFPDYEKWTL